MQQGRALPADESSLDLEMWEIGTSSTQVQSRALADSHLEKSLPTTAGIKPCCPGVFLAPGLQSSKIVIQEGG